MIVGIAEDGRRYEGASMIDGDLFVLGDKRVIDKARVGRVYINDVQRELAQALREIVPSSTIGWPTHVFAAHQST